ncbi:MAG: hypothetical protein MUC48_22130 [Leptolyngbya sp. Prado105]|nr:hypothetical protein [Leptolyngbya sp. Prado105]
MSIGWQRNLESSIWGTIGINSAKYGIPHSLLKVLHPRASKRLKFLQRKWINVLHLSEDLKGRDFSAFFAIAAK